MNVDPTLSRQDRAADDETSPPITVDEDLDAEARGKTAEESEEGAAGKVKEKAKELLDKVSGPDVPPAMTDEGEEKRRA
jgi:hypothetical protein